MLLRLVEYHWAEDIDDALLLLGRLDVKTVPLAGGTYLLGLHDDSIQAVVDLRELELAYISEDDRGLHIGAMTTLQGMAEAPLLKKFASGLLAQTAQASSSSRLIRNCATLGGTLGVGIASQADLLTALIALDAEVIVRSGSRTQVNLSGGSAERPGLALSGVTFKGKRERRISCDSLALNKLPGELIVEVNMPALSANCGASFMRISRTPGDVALLNAAALVEIDNGLYRRVRLVFGGINMEPLRLRLVERQLEGQSAAQPFNQELLLNTLRVALNDFRPPSDVRASSAYRRVSGANLAYHVLEEAMKVAHWHGVVSSEGMA